MTYTVEDIQKILTEHAEFDFVTLNNNGEEITLSADSIVFAHWIIDAYHTTEICVAYQDYDICNITPISKIIKIL